MGLFTIAIYPLNILEAGDTSFFLTTVVQKIIGELR